ncbi:hypothetical protein [Streptomyces sp. AC495_CC817]|uniref:hypothetical protein n=1 Tax=Streptomyces sp. AC495_CC817 TaxID=2823900 RepID=UPI001C26289C|nr:hypothetical protein [Streptomyces sp. AC495_CC817]
MRIPAETRRDHGPTMTRAYLQSAAFAAVQAMLVIGLAPLTPHLAGWFPPAYALVAGLHTLLIFTSRRFTGLRGGATLTAALTAVVCGPFTAIGWLIAAPLLLAGLLFDGVLAVSANRGWGERIDIVLSGAVVGTGLFVVSLPVMSLPHLGPVIVAATLAARIIASAGGALLSARLVRRLERIGVRRAVAAARPAGTTGEVV